MQTDYKGYTITVEEDSDPMHPRENDNLGNMVCWHRRYSLGDDNPKERPDEYREMIKRTHGEVIELPLYLYDHGGVAMQTSPFVGWQHWEWDSGQVGFIWCSKKQIRDWFGVKRVTKRVIERAIKNLEAEVVEYDHFLRGEIYCMRIDKGDAFVDGCSDFYTEEDALKCGKEIVDGQCRHAQVPATCPTGC